MISDDDIAEMRDIVREIDRRYKEGARAMKGGVVRPTDVTPVIATNRLRERGVFLMRFGYRMAQTGGNVINARSETMLRRPMFMQSGRERRCLIPASYYYEWERHDAEKQKFALYTPKERLFYMAGLYRYENEHDAMPSFVILTRPAAPEIAFIHDRMPVILKHDDMDAWLSPAADVDDLLARADLDVDCLAV